MPETAPDIEELAAQADKSMYVSKHGGRNQVTRFSPNLT
jgi:PleD family two-component response regulator